MPRLISPISSRNSVPRSATSKSPRAGAIGARERAAHVAEQRRLEQALGDGAAVLAHERPAARAPFAWMARATSSLPLPDSPMRSTGTSERSRDRRAGTCARMGSLSPMISS